MGRQRQGMDRPGVWQVPEGSGEQGKWRKLVAKSSVDDDDDDVYPSISTKAFHKRVASRLC